MKIEIKRNEWTCRVTKEPGDPYFTTGTWGDAESRFLYHVKLELIKQGYDVIKKRMWKDGHMVDETRQYIRSRNVSDPIGFCLYNDRYAYVDAGKEFNKYGEFDLCYQELN